MTKRAKLTGSLFFLGLVVFWGLLLWSQADSIEDYGNGDRVREKIREHLPEQAERIQERFGLKPFDRESEKVKNGPVVILIHGLDDPGKVWMNLAPALQESGYRVWVMNYPNDQPIRESAGFVFDQIRSGPVRTESELILIAHSMGGLVAREMLTSPLLAGGGRCGQAGFPTVRQLILVATPNKGSRLAHLRGFAELREQAVHLTKGEFHWLLPILDGTGEAGMDLLPGSHFLRDLNSRKSPEHLQMMIIAGVMSPVENEDTRTFIQGLSEGLSPERKRDFNRVADQVNSVFNTLGDGAVSLESARLPGIPMQTVSGTHLSIIRNISSSSNRTPPAIPVILEALKKS